MEKLIGLTVIIAIGLFFIMRKNLKYNKQLKNNIKDNFDDFFFFEKSEEEMMRKYLFENSSKKRPYVYQANDKGEVYGVFYYSGGGVTKVAQKGSLIPKSMIDHCFDQPKYKNLLKDSEKNTSH